MRARALSDIFVSLARLTNIGARAIQPLTPFVSSISSAVGEVPGRTLSRIASVRAKPGALVVALILIATAIAPAVTMLYSAHSTNRNVAYWDEIDTAVGLLLRLDSGRGIKDFVLQMLAITNEHRTVTSRLLFAGMHALTGEINFIWIGLIGNGFVVVASALLVLGVPGTESRIRLGVLLGFLLYHLGHYENFLWSGSSIDHFQVVALVVGSCVALRYPTRVNTGLAVVAALLATFTLAHGLMMWPVGAAMLARERRWRELAFWSGVALFAAIVFLAGFHVNPGHRIGASGLASLLAIFLYWLNVLGSPLAFGHVVLAQSLGAALVAFTLDRTARGAWERERNTLPILWFVLGAALLIAIGRADLNGDTVRTRYIILGGIGWSLVLLQAIERWRNPQRPYLILVCMLPALIAYNVAQHVRYRSDALTFIEHRDQAALRYRQHGKDGRAPLMLHPQPEHSSRVLAQAAQHGVYHMPPLCERREFPRAKPSTRLTCYVDECSVNDNAIYIAGWVGLSHRAIRRGQIHLVLRSGETFLAFTTAQIRRPDVVQAHQNPAWEFSGFHAAVARARIPPGEYQVGLLVTGDRRPEFTMTERTVRFAGSKNIALHE